MTRRCKCGCGESLPPVSKCETPLQKKRFFGIECYVSFIKAEKIRKAEAKKKKELTEKKRALRDGDRSYWLKKTQMAFNAYVRERDKDRPCISCGRFHEGKYDAGHYRTVGGNPELRFEELNCWKQCQPCNRHLSGNIVNYRKSLLEIIGEEKLDWLEGPHKAKRYTIDDLKKLTEHFKKAKKELAEPESNLNG